MKIHKYKRTPWQLIEIICPFVLNSVLGCVVEIGAGVTTGIIYKYASDFERQFYSCDLKKNFDNIIKIRKLGKFFTPFKGSSDDFAKQFNKEIAFAFIDGCHRYEFIKRDFEFIYGLLNPGGVVLMHDTLPPSKGHAGPSHCRDAYKLRLELEKREDIEIISWSYPNQVGISMVMKKRRMWYPPEEKKWD